MEGREGERERKREGGRGRDKRRGTYARQEEGSDDGGGRGGGGGEREERVERMEGQGVKEKRKRDGRRDTIELQVDRNFGNAVYQHVGDTDEPELSKLVHAWLWLPQRRMFHHAI
ncbi:hypothetical protein G5I_04420 [Acromyrmex echinatior]|uniref:Uncharacterized protein n=1 Tax=Acromyrmex echinatior TaxID=103372 RepID=F4WFL1_ACREC|nr:hypothetical protein G5I_04420 [Acromyrmex echinatior]